MVFQRSPTDVGRCDLMNLCEIEKQLAEHLLAYGIHAAMPQQEKHGCLQDAVMRRIRDEFVVGTYESAPRQGLLPQGLSPRTPAIPPSCRR